MAERRMFAKAIINSGKFLMMPASSRLLYYDLGMRADDDGVVEAYSVMMQTKASEDDLRVLASKGYIRVLNDDFVTLICDWKVNNFIRSDRYHPSIYAELIEQPDGNGIPTDNHPTTVGIPCGIPTDNQRDTEVRLGKVSIDKVNNTSSDFSKKSEENSLKKAQIESEFEQIWRLYPRKEEKKRAFSAYSKARTKKENPCTFEEVLEGVQKYRKFTANKESQYIKTGATWFNGECWNDEYSSQTSPEKPVDPEIEKYKVLINKF